MQTARIFTNGNNQEDEVVIKKLGDIVVLLPKRYRAESLMAMLQELAQWILSVGSQPNLKNETLNEFLFAGYQYLHLPAEPAGVALKTSFSAWTAGAVKTSVFPPLPLPNWTMALQPAKSKVTTPSGWGGFYSILK